MDHLAVLARLAGQAVERAREALAAVDAQLVERRAQIAQAQCEIEREAAAASGLDGARLLATWLVARRRQLARAEGEIVHLEDARAAQLARLVERRLELKRLELLQARQRERAAAEARASEQRASDEVASIRAARRALLD
jgi:flagellar biosynthesis chaperone FliJ